jgi:DNA-directed RNA polymerase specialized sigma24 family protein
VTLKRASSTGSLSQEGFDRLLALFHPDRDRAGLQYEALRHKLVRFFEWRRCHAADELADETLDRVSRKLLEGVEIRIQDPASFVYGVARNIAREALVRAARHPLPLAVEVETEDALDRAHTDPAAEDADRALHCLDRCLEAMPAETRRLLLVYHSDKRGSPARQRFLDGLRVSPGALWVRMFRLRKRLERCVQGCMNVGPFAVDERNPPGRHSSVKEGDEP